jgi:hypothetical protein
MREGLLGAALIGGLIVAGAASAQNRDRGPEQPSIMQEEDPSSAPPQQQPTTPSRRTRGQIAAPAPQSDPNLDAEDQLAPSQMKQPMPAAVAEPSRAPARAAKHAAKQAATSPEPRAQRPIRGAALHAVACSGPFARDSSNLGLAMAFDSRNVTFTDVDGGAIGKVSASVLYPKDPKRRLEVWWNNPGSRSDISLIVINGQSGWAAPGGLRLGLTLAELEKLNRKPFKLKGFDNNRVASVSDWDGGALAAFAGGCKAGVSLRADPKAAAEAIGAFTADHEYSSNDAALRAAKPEVSEILIGY